MIKIIGIEEDKNNQFYGKIKETGQEVEVWPVPDDEPIDFSEYAEVDGYCEAEPEMQFMMERRCLIRYFSPAELSMIEAEAKHCGFPSAESFLEIEAGLWRLAILHNSGCLAKHFGENDNAYDAFTAKIDPIGMALKFKTFRREVKGQDTIQYLLFADGSLYLDSNAEDEVWASATDFADEYLVNLPVDEIHRAERQLLRKLGGSYKKRAKTLKREQRCEKWLAILEKFLASEDYLQGCVSATRAAYGGSGYSVEMFHDGTWRVLWDNQIGNGYDSPGIIIGLPTFESATEDTETHEDEESAIREAAECYADDEKEMMREAVRAHFEM